MSDNFVESMMSLEECFRLVGNWKAEVRRLEGLNAAANRIIAEQATAIAGMADALRGAEWLLDNIKEWTPADVIERARDHCRAALALVTAD